MLVNDAERRAFTRLPVDCKVVYKKPGDPDVLFGRGRNLSGNGIMFIADRAITVGTELEVNVLPTNPSFAPLNAVVKVVRMEPSPSASQFAIAGAIQRILN